MCTENWENIVSTSVVYARSLSASEHWPQQQQQKQQKQQDQPSKGDGPSKSGGLSGANATEEADTPEEKAARAGLLKRTQVSFTMSVFKKKKI